jgi:hypothetical protein
LRDLIAKRNRGLSTAPAAMILVLPFFASLRGTRRLSIFLRFHVRCYTREVIWFSEVYQTLRKHGLRISDWIFAIQRGEIQPLRTDFQRLSRGACLTQFFFYREEFVAYLMRQGVEMPPLVIAATPAAESGKRVNWPALAQRLQERQEHEQRHFTRKGSESYAVMDLPLAARRWPTDAP